MLVATFDDPAAATWMPLVTSRVAAFCWSTASKIAPAIRDRTDRAADLGDGVDGFPGRGLHPDNLRADFVRGFRGLRGECLDLLRHDGEALAGFACTRASMVALSASRLVCSAIALIILMTSPMRAAASLRPATRPLAPSACLTASFAIRSDS
jgi:hypothetical protein